MFDKKDEPTDRLITPSRRSSVEHLPALNKILASRTRMLVCFATLPVYMLGVWLLLANGRSIDGFLMFYCIIWSVFALDMMLRRCPACKQQYYVKEIWMNFRTTQCVHCKLGKDAIETESKREF